MTLEESKLLRENNKMLKQILYILQQDNTNYMKDFVVNFFADQASRSVSPINY